METRFSTSAVHPRDRFDYWHSVACKTLVSHDSIPECRGTFRAELKSGALAEIGLVLFENSPMTISHKASHVAHAGADELFVCRQVAGGVILEQDGREAALEPGDMTLLDPRSPYAGRFYADSSMLVLKVPRHLLEVRVGKTREMTARAIKARAAESRLTSAFLAMLPAHAEGLGRATEEIVKNQALDLIAMTLGEASGGRKTGTSSARSLVLMSVRVAIEARLTDPALDASTVAAAAGVSIRYANAVLAEEGLSISRLIQERRLARCRTAFEDPLQTHRTVSEIAYGWGFSDMTHFGRRFRAAFGLLPNEYRKAHRGDPRD